MSKKRKANPEDKDTVPEKTPKRPAKTGSSRPSKPEGPTKPCRPCRAGKKLRATRQVGWSERWSRVVPDLISDSESDTDIRREAQFPDIADHSDSDSEDCPDAPDPVPKFARPYYDKQHVYPKIFDPFDAKEMTPEEHIQKATTLGTPFRAQHTNGDRHRWVMDEMEQEGRGILKWRRRQLRYWEKRARETRSEMREWRDAMPSHVRDVIGHVNLPLLQEMLEHAGFPDENLIQDLRTGFPVIGVLPDSGVFKPIEVGTILEKSELEQIARKQWKLYSTELKPFEHIEFAWSKIEEEFHQYRLEAPRSFPVGKKPPPFGACFFFGGALKL